MKSQHRVDQQLWVQTQKERERAYYAQLLVLLVGANRA
jgi:hypothetical protein